MAVPDVELQELRTAFGARATAWPSADRPEALARAIVDASGLARSDGEAEAGVAPETAERANAVVQQLVLEISEPKEATRGQSAFAAAGPSFEALAAGYASDFAACVVRPEHQAAVGWYADHVKAGQAQYKVTGTATGVPWWFVGVLHGLEADFSFQSHLHNGDPLSAKTVHAPPNRPQDWLPPSDWQSSARDALTFEHFAHLADWSLAHTLFRFEAYNGFGSRNHGVKTPYLWSFSTLYTKGKYVADRQWDPNAVSEQCGAAVMIKVLAERGDVNFN